MLTFYVAGVVQYFCKKKKLNLLDYIATELKLFYKFIKQNMKK